MAERKTVLFTTFNGFSYLFDESGIRFKKKKKGQRYATGSSAPGLYRPHLAGLVAHRLTPEKAPDRPC